MKRKENWKGLTIKELKDLSSEYEKEAVRFDMKLSRFVCNTSSDTTKEVKMKLERLWNIGNILWTKVRSIEIWRRKNNE